MATKVKLVADGVVTADQLTLTTAASGTNTTAPATTAFVQQEVAALVDSAPGTLNTLNELAAALGDDANFSTTVTDSIATKLPLAGGALTGNLSIGDSSSRSFALYVENAGSAGAGQLMLVDSDNDTLQREIRTDAGVLSFDYWDSSNRSNHLTILANGNVGIGNTNPSANLHISDSNGAAVLKIDTSATADAGIQILGYDAYVGLGDATNGLQWYVWNDGVSASSSLKFGSEALSGSAWYADASQAMVITSSGNVGIGTTTPAKNLEIFGSGSESGILVKNDTNTNYRGYYISSVESDNTAYGKLHMDLNSGELNITSGYSGWGGFITFDANGTERMRITSSGNIQIGGFTGTESGGSGARWINLDTPGSNTYSSGLLYKINGTVKAYHYVENDNIIHQTTSGVGQRFFAGTTTALTIASDGEIYNDSTRAAGVTLNGFVNLGKNADGRDGDIVSIRGTGLYQQSSGNRYGNYGTIRLNATGNWTGAARRVLITNGLNTYKFGILSGTTSATTNPDITSTSSDAGSLVNGTPNFVIDLTNGRIGYQTDSPAFAHHTYGTTESSNSSSAAGQQHSAVQSSNAPAGGYYEKVRYYSFSGNNDHTLIWGNTDSYFSAMVELWAGCSNGGTRNNIYVRGFWHSNHTSHLWDELDRTANVANGDTFTFTAGAYTSGSTASKLTLFHDYGSASFYYGKVKITVICGDYSYYNIAQS